MSGVITTSKSDQPNTWFCSLKVIFWQKSAPAAFFFILHHVAQNAWSFTSAVWQYHCSTVSLVGFLTSMFRLANLLQLRQILQRLVSLQVLQLLLRTLCFCAVDFLKKSSTKLFNFLAIFYSPCKWFNRSLPRHFSKWWSCGIILGVLLISQQQWSSKNRQYLRSYALRTQCLLRSNLAS